MRRSDEVTIEELIQKALIWSRRTNVTLILADENIRTARRLLKDKRGSNRIKLRRRG